MDAGTLSIKKIFGQDRRHLVPLFQRPYVWQRETQWEPFWEDIRSVAERMQTGDDPRPHFLGAIVLDQVPKPTGQVETRLVIDGQQRLTTIQLFAEAFCDLCGAAGIDKHFKALLKLTRNDDPMSEDPDEVFKVWPTNVDQEHFRRVMNCGSPGDLRKKYDEKGNGEIGHPIADAYLYFHEAISSWLAVDTLGHEERLDALFNTVREYIRLVVIDLDKEDDAQLIFETLNARGTPLLPSDLVKNFLFHRASLAGEDIGHLYNTHWRGFDEGIEYWRAQIGRGHARRARIDTFLQHYLSLQKRQEIPIAHLYVTFREFAGKTGYSRDTFMSLSRYAEVYQSFDQFEPGSREALFFERIGSMDLTTVFPFLMELFARHRDDAATTQVVLTDLESFLVRRMLCQLSTRGYNRLFIEMLAALAESKGPPVQRVREFLLGSDAESNRWPDDTEFRQAWTEYPTYRELVQRRVRMLLEAIEHALRTGKTENVQLDDKLTIEHLLPQAWRKNWPLPSTGDAEQAEADRNRLLHTIGNLTLVTGKLNPSVSNGHWDKKRTEIIQHSVLRLNNQLGKFATWDEAAIRERGAALFDVAARIWPYPER